MKSLFGQNYDPPFIPVTLVKCVAAESWLNDLLFSSGQKPYDIETTPEPELDEEEILQISEETLKKELEVSLANSNGFDKESILNNVTNKVKYKVKQKIKERSEEILKPVKTKIEDQLVEGGWYKALKQVISDIVVFKAGILKGPVYKPKKKLKIKNGNVVVEREIIPCFERVSPFNIYPDPDASNVNDGYLFEKISYTKSELASFLELDGINKTELETVLALYSDSSYTIQVPADTERKSLEDKQFSGMYNNKIDCLEFWGSVDGKKIIEWNNGSTNLSGITLDPLEYYDICAWIIDKHVIRVILNPDPLGNKPYYKSSWIEIQDSFWGMGIPEIVSDIQDACNSVARNMLLNAAFSSGPVSEINIDRLAEGESSNIHPFKNVKVTSRNMAEAPVVRFNQAQLVADRLIMVYRHFSQIADEVTVPAYAHGDQNIGGAGRTATGLSMLYRGATKNIRNVLDNLDNNIIAPSITTLYNMNLIFNTIEVIPDLNIKARGSLILLLREQKSKDLTELLSILLSPAYINEVDTRALVEAIIEAKGLEVTKILKDPIEKMIEQQQIQQMQSQDLEALKNNPTAYNATVGGSMPKPKEETLSGDTVAGTDTREVGNG